jgi:hypothetical protein
MAGAEVEIVTAGSMVSTTRALEALKVGSERVRLASLPAMSRTVPPFAKSALELTTSRSLEFSPAPTVYLKVRAVVPLPLM